MSPTSLDIHFSPPIYSYTALDIIPSHLIDGGITGAPCPTTIWIDTAPVTTCLGRKVVYLRIYKYLILTSCASMRTESFISAGELKQVRWVKMAKHRVCTTISKKHWELLKKHTAEFVTQQKALEAALQSLEKISNGNNDLSPEERVWMRMGKDLRQNLCVIHKEVFKALLRTADFEQLNRVVIGLKLTEYQVAFYCQKPVKDCGLEEIMDGIVQTLKIANLFDSINYTDCGSHYSLEIIHTLGTRNTDATMSFKLFFQDFFETYGVKTEGKISENSLFMKIHKNSKLMDK